MLPVVDLDGAFGEGLSVNRDAKTHISSASVPVQFMVECAALRCRR
jgi:hypothetical protein